MFNSKVECDDEIKDSPSTKVDWQDDPFHETEDLFVGLDQAIHVVVVQNNVQQEVAKEVMEMDNDQAKELSDQEVANDCLDDKQVKERRPSKRIKDTQGEWSRMKSQKKG
ncbi:hypothetical protein Tco_0156627 [Tanacetum coccineum]